jgi:hypothetical protein
LGVRVASGLESLLEHEGMLAHLRFDLGQRLTPILPGTYRQNECDVPRHAVRDRGRLHATPRKPSSDVERLRGWVRKQVVGELEDLVLASAREQLGHNLTGQLRA